MLILSHLTCTRRFLSGFFFHSPWAFSLFTFSSLPFLFSVHFLVTPIFILFIPSFTLNSLPFFLFSSLRLSPSIFAFKRGFPILRAHEMITAFYVLSLQQSLSLCAHYWVLNDIPYPIQPPFVRHRGNVCAFERKSNLSSLLSSAETHLMCTLCVYGTCQVARRYLAHKTSV